MIKHQQEKYGWAFMFLGANIDAFAEASSLNIPQAMTANFAPTATGAVEARKFMTDRTTTYRTKN